MAEYAAPMPVGGIEGVVRIDTSHVASDLAAVLKALQAVDDVLNSVSGGSSSRFADAFRQTITAGRESASASHAAASAADTYSVAATAGASAAQMHAQAMHGYTTAAIQGRSAAQMFADTVQASNTVVSGAATAQDAATSALADYASGFASTAKAVSDFYAMMGVAGHSFAPVPAEVVPYIETAESAFASYARTTVDAFQKSKQAAADFYSMLGMGPAEKNPVGPVQGPLTKDQDLARIFNEYAEGARSTAQAVSDFYDMMGVKGHQFENVVAGIIPVTINSTTAFASYANATSDAFLKSQKAAQDFYAMMGVGGSNTFEVQFDKAASSAKRFAATVHDAHMDVIPFADANENAAERSARAWGQTRTVLKGMTDNEMTKADRGARELGEKMYHGANRGAGGAKEFNYQLMAMAYTLDDLQYVGEQGLRPILNNLIMIHPALGIAALGANTLYENWDKIAKLWGEGITLTEAEDMERLAKATEKTAQQERDLANYKEKRAKAEAAMRITSKAEDDQKKGVDAAIKAAGGGKAVVEKIAASMITPNADGLSNQVTGDSFRDYFTTKKEFEAEVEKWKKSANANPIERAIIERRIKDLKLKMSHLKNDNRKEVEFEALNLLGQATTDPNKLKQLQAIVPGFEGATPEAQARQKAQVEGLKKWGKQKEEDERETQRWIAEDQRKNQQLTDKTQREREKAGKDAIRLAEKSEKAEIKVEEDVAKAELRAIKEAEDAKDKIARDIDRAKIAMMSPARRRAFLRARAKALLAGQGELPPGGGGGVAGAAVGAGADAGIGGAPVLPRMSARLRRTNRARLAAAAARRGAAAPIDLGIPGGDQAAPALNPDTNLNFKPPALNLEKPPELSAPLSDKEVKQMLGDIRDASNQTAGALATLVSDTTRDRG